jgi:trans-2,3-dihydro-3-hydroxyanthranilate isomerase
VPATTRSARGGGWRAADISSFQAARALPAAAGGARVAGRNRRQRRPASGSNHGTGSARFGTTVTQTGPVANALGLELADVRDNLPTQVVDTGAAHLLVPVRDRETVDRAQPDAAALRNELAVASAQGCYIYSIDSLSLDDVAYTRFFNPTVGIWEDPATGSAAGPLAAFLVAREVVADGATIFIEQGHALGRPSRIQVTVEGHAVRIGGAGVVVAEGMLQL